MNWQRWRWKYWMDVFRRRKLDQDLDKEIQAHIAIEVQRRIELGESPQSAHTAAMREIRSVDFVKEATRDVRAWGVCERFAQDLRYAARLLRKSPLFTSIAILSLALGIGANTAIFTMVNAVLLKTLPVSDPEHLVILTSFQRNGRVGNFAYPDYERLRDGSQVFSGVLAASRPTPTNVGVNNEPQRALVQLVSGNYFSVIGVRAFLGRTLMKEDDDSAAAVISHAYWQRFFGGDPGALGRSLTVNGSITRIVGVAPPEFFGETVGQATDVWLPMSMLQSVRPSSFDLRNVRFVTWLYLMGRLKPEMTAEKAHAEAEVLVARIHEEFRIDPEMDYLHHIVMEPGSRGSAGLRNSFSVPLLLLMGVVGFVLLIACTNLASLLLSRAATRQREIATRLALGATRARLIRQLLTESVLLAVLAGALGLLFAFWSNRLLLGLVSEGLGSISISLYPDSRVLLFSAAVAVLTGICFGLAPAIQAVHVDVSPKLKTTSRASTDAARRWGVKNGLITVQVALSLVLLSGGLLFSRSLWNLKTLDLGLRPDNVLLVGIGPQDQRQDANLAARLLERVSAIPGVQSASISVNTPLGSSGSGVNGIEVPGYKPQSKEDQQARADWVGPGYFKTLGMELLQGREFSYADTVNSHGVVVINETMARHFFADRTAVASHLRFNEREYEIVGLVRDAKYRELRESTPRMLYFAFLQTAAGGPITLELRTAGPPIEIAGAAREAIREVESRLSIRDVVTLSSLIDRKLAPEFLVAGMSGFFSALTLLLVCIGIYGTLGFTVARRTNEIGVRVALGARPASVLLMVLQDITRPLAAGLVLGLLVVLAVGPLLKSLLFELKPHDPATIVFAALLLGLVALAAAYIPARRASRVDPVAALRFE